MTTVSVDTGVRERVHAAIVAAIQATGQGGLVRAVSTIATGFEHGFTVSGILNDAKVRIAATKTREERVGNQPTHIRLVTAAYALHVLRDYTTAEEALEFATVIGRELVTLVDMPNTSAEVRYTTVANLYAAKAQAKSQRLAAAALARKELSRVVNRQYVALAESADLLGEEYSLDAETVADVQKLANLLADILRNSL